MPTLSTPTSRLEAKLLTQQCKVCQWLATLDEKSRGEWAQAIGNTRFPATLVAAEITAEGGEVSDGSIQNHRRKNHR